MKRLFIFFVLLFAAYGGLMWIINWFLDSFLQEIDQ